MMLNWYLFFLFVNSQSELFEWFHTWLPNAEISRYKLKFYGFSTQGLYYFFRIVPSTKWKFLLILQ